jgi:hypothetical protein
MTNKEVYQDRLSENQKPIGRVNNEPEQPVDTVPTPVQEEEVGMINNEAPGEMEPSAPKIGRINNEESSATQPPVPEIGMTNNELADKVKTSEPTVEKPVLHS